MWRRFQIKNFSSNKDGRLTLNLGITNVGSYLCIFFFFFFIAIKKNPKSLFHKKNLFYWKKIWKMLWSKQDAQRPYQWAQKKFQPEKIKIEGFISNKKLKSHFRDPKRRFFSFNFVLLVFLHAVYLLQTVV